MSLRLPDPLARLYEEQQEDFESACKWYARLFREAPGDASVREQLQRLGGIVEDWEFVAETYQAYLDDERGESEEVREVAIAAGVIYDRRLNNTDAAFVVYRRALGIEVEPADLDTATTPMPTARELVRRLEDLLGRSQRWADLIQIYDDVITRTDEDLRREALVKRARLLEHGLGDPAKAIEAWREVVIVAEEGESPIEVQTYLEAVAELERLFRELVLVP